MRNQHGLPLGIDVGQTRVRVAYSEMTDSGPRIAAIAASDVPEGTLAEDLSVDAALVATVVEQLRAELGCRQRRCVLALDIPVAALRIVRFPKMRASERIRAAVFEAERIAAWDTASVPSIVRVHPYDARQMLYAIGIVRKSAIASRVEALKHAGLRVTAVDHHAFALQRVFPFADAVIDIGHRAASLHAFGSGGPLSLRVHGGGSDLTRAIADDLSIDLALAEKRKRILGTAGAGEAARDRFVEQIRVGIERLRERYPIRRIALTGNAARLPNLVPAIEAATGAIAEMPVADVLRGGAYPDDVIRAGAPDWTLAASLSLWKRAA